MVEIIKGAEEFSLGRGEHAMLFIHGWGSSPRDFKGLAESLGDGFFCRGLRLKGHGTSPEDLNQYTWREHFDQVVEAFSELASQYQKVSVAGFSYGGTLALHLASRRRVKNLVLFSPYYQSPRWKGVLRLHRLARFIPDRVGAISKWGDGPMVDKEALAKHIIYDIMPVRSLKSTIQCAAEAAGILEKIYCPVFILHSVGDKTACFDGGVYILKHLGSLEKSLSAFNNSNHVIMLDLDRAEVERQVNAWLRDRI